MGLVSRHHVPAMQVSSVQTGLFRAPWVEQFSFAMSESLGNGIPWCDGDVVLQCVILDKLVQSTCYL